MLPCPCCPTPTPLPPSLAAGGQGKAVLMCTTQVNEGEIVVGKMGEGMGGEGKRWGERGRERAEEGEGGWEEYHHPCQYYSASSSGLPPASAPAQASLSHAVSSSRYLPVTSTSWCQPQTHCRSPEHQPTHSHRQSPSTASDNFDTLLESANGSLCPSSHSHVQPHPHAHGVRLVNMLGMVHHLIAPTNDFIGLTQTYSSFPETTRSSVSSPTTPLFNEIARLYNKTARLYNETARFSPRNMRPPISLYSILNYCSPGPPKAPRGAWDTTAGGELICSRGSGGSSASQGVRIVGGTAAGWAAGPPQKKSTKDLHVCSSASANSLLTSQFTPAPQNHVLSGACTLHDQCDTRWDTTGVKMDNTPVRVVCVMECGREGKRMGRGWGGKERAVREGCQCGLTALQREEEDAALVLPPSTHVPADVGVHHHDLIDAVLRHDLLQEHTHDHDHAPPKADTRVRVRGGIVIVGSLLVLTSLWLSTSGRGEEGGAAGDSRGKQREGNMGQTRIDWLKIRRTTKGSLKYRQLRRMAYNTGNYVGQPEIQATT
ncbi:hypothetical protein DFH08DRAFT_826397 [Mycena albidolilacea]|uniref:Uncharacterized protein n=1 Tax=Mycena albidolilacea TaxID=1033008 RepID=A0AAD7E8Z0_9AGAR|nr:hypothetical protein DFH08DRAFT_826397 [Mycena albidolilacea]